MAHHAQGYRPTSNNNHFPEGILMSSNHVSAIAHEPPAQVDWQSWLQRWDIQQTGYLSDRGARFKAMLDVLDALLPETFVALDLACGPGAISQRLLARFHRRAAWRWTSTLSC